MNQKELDAIRQKAETNAGKQWWAQVYFRLLAEVEKLHAENARLRKALIRAEATASDFYESSMDGGYLHIRNDARAALVDSTNRRENLDNPK